MGKFDADATRVALGMALRSTIFFIQEFKFLLAVDKAFYPENRVVDNGLHGAKATTYVRQSFHDKPPYSWWPSQKD
jgi:hypothetical protein